MEQKIIELPHTVCPYTCMVNGLRDVYQWKTGQTLPDEFMMITSGMASFVYLKHKKTKPPFMVFWGQNLKYQYRNLEHIFGFEISVREGRSFDFSLNLVKKEIDKGNPVVIGPLDMFYLEYRDEFFQKIHIFPHFVLTVGYNDHEDELFLYDCDLSGIQRLSYDNLRLAWQRGEPGYIKRNAVITFSLSERRLTLNEVVKRGLLLKANQMLNPPISNLGIPGIRKLAEEFLGWETLLSREDYKLALENMAMYANTPPTLSPEVDNFTGRRRELSELLMELASLTNIGGLKTGSSVVIAGVEVGRVEHISLDDYRANVSLNIPSDIKIQEDAIASVKTKGLIGEKYIEITPGGSEKTLKPGGRIRDTQPAVDMEHLISNYVFGKL